MMKKTSVIVVCGATASGKTALAVELAERFGGEIVGADSMQVYKGMDIATAKPSASELRGIKHHLIDFLEPHETFSVADYVDMARDIISDVSKRGKLPVIAGGTGLYINSLIENIEFPEVKADKAFREEMQKREGEVLLDELRRKDPETAALLHKNNVKRVIRALEVLHVTGRTIGELNRESRLKPSPYDALLLQIDLPRERLYERINSRVDEMMTAGLLEEARGFFTRPNSSTSVQAIGYKELLPFLSNQAGLGECVERLKKSTRNYAKRQLTWFKKVEGINRLESGDIKKAEEIIRMKSDWLTS
jgi:tRNA dimethylallyltransferase